METLKDGVGGQGLERLEKMVMRPGGCRTYMRKRLAREFPAIVDGFVEQAKTGSVPHLKLATELLKPVRQGTTRKKSEAVRLLDRMVKSRPVKANVVVTE
jgi:hypothetical protein